MFILDGHQFGQTIEEAYVPCRHNAAGHQVVEGSTDVQHHLTWRHLLATVGGQFLDQVTNTLSS